MDDNITAQTIRECLQYPQVDNFEDIDQDNHRVKGETEKVIQVKKSKDDEDMFT